MKQNPPIDSLPVEDVATIQTWIDFLEHAPGVVSMTICLSDGETLYTIEKDGSEMIGEETADEYLDRLTAEAFPSWQGVDPQRFMDEVRGRNAVLEWKKGVPKEAGVYVVADSSMVLLTYFTPRQTDESGILFHIGPVPKAPNTDEG